MKKPKLLIVDIDGMFYHSTKETIEESIQSFKDKFQNMIDATGATHYVGFYTNGKTFRNQIFSGYKANRKQDPPKWLKALKEWAIQEYGFQCMSNVEADDLVVYWYNKDICISDETFETREMLESALDLCRSEKMPLFTFESVDKVIASPDKDIYNIVDKCFNYTYKLADRNNPDSVVKGWWIENYESDIDTWRRMVMIVGDTSDAIPGLIGKGIKYWEKISKDIKPSWGEILHEYIINYGLSQGIYEFQKNYRLLHILNSDQDFLREVNEIPMFPVIRSVYVEVEDDVKLEF